MKWITILVLTVAASTALAGPTKKPFVDFCRNLFSSNAIQTVGSEPISATSTEVYLGKVSGESVYFHIPVSAIADPKGHPSGVSGNLKAYPHIQITGGHLYQALSGDQGSTQYIPLVKTMFYDPSANGVRTLDKTDDELEIIISSFVRQIPSLVVERVRE